MLGIERLSAELPAWTDRLASLVASGDPGTPVPTCPEWSLLRLAQHVGGSARWATTIVASRAREPVRFRDSRGRPMPADSAAVPDWMGEGAAELVAAVHGVGPDTPVWTWTDRRTAGFWLQRMTYEAVVHTADAALSLGEPVRIEADLGAAGVDEWLTILPFLPAGRSGVALPVGRALHLHAVDASGEWLVRGTPDGPSWEAGHGKADVAVRAGAGSLFLLLNRRLAADDPRFEIHGDRTILDRWLAATVF